MNEKTQKLKFLSRDAIKYLAIIPMSVGHFFSYTADWENISPIPLWFKLLTQMSLIAPPIFFFFIAEGFHYTRSRKSYAVRLLIFALITQIPFCLANNGTLLTAEFFTSLNIFFTLFFGVLSLTIWEKDMPLKKKIFLLIIADAATLLFFCEWLIFGIPIILGFYIYREQPRKRMLWFAACILLHQIIEFIFALDPVNFFMNTAFFALSYLCVTIFYNGKKGRYPAFAKWFFYLFYPAHLLVIWLVKYL
ncbi:MAG: hypothetical protein IJZ72_08820 [Oscillospiraceae bacterium]|nr:hypothetical protein [Oscillospiraceae bacterium]